MLHLTHKPRLVLPLTFASPATRNRTRDHLIAAKLYSQMLCQLSYSRLVIGPSEPSHNLVLSLDLPCPLTWRQSLLSKISMLKTHHLCLLD